MGLPPVQLCMIMVLALSLALAPVQIPENFLLSEKAARAPQTEEEKGEEWWKISDRLDQPLLLNPCRHKRATTADRSAVRTITHDTSAPSHSGEQLVIHRNSKAARTAMRKLLADARRCVARPYGKPYSWADDGRTRWVVNRTRLADEASLMRFIMGPPSWIPRPSGWGGNEAPA
ncbi:hypothetical protein GCM10014719_49390 [Planomonospora parontospora subsp. antibiotica]|nr:hypothetical protein GCM10014719_49390 [Planomonospora parontospora subsp. antibiotica]